MQDAFAQFGRAGGIDAAVIGLALHAHYMAAANRAALRHLEMLVPARVLVVFNHLDDLGNHVPTALNHHPVADLYSEALDLIHVVQRGAAHRGAPDGYRLEPGDRRELPGASYLGLDVFHLRDPAARSVFVSSGP